MGKTNILLSVVISGIFLISCEKEPNNPDTTARGAIIHNLPAWLASGNGYASDWQDWQGESGILLHEFVPESVLSGNFDGKYRLYLSYGTQDISIGFNDAEGTTYCLFYNWYDRFPKGTTNSHISVSQAHPDTEFSFDCHAKINLSEEANASNQSHVTIYKKNQGDKYACRYVQTMAGKEIINTELFPVNFFTFDRRKWLPNDVIDPSSGDFIIQFSYNFIPQHYCGMEMTLNGKNYQKHQILSAEGLTVKEYDDSKQVISFHLADAQTGGFADYFTFTRNGDIGELSYYKNVEDSPVLIKAYKNLICKDTN